MRLSFEFYTLKIYGKLEVLRKSSVQLLLHAYNAGASSSILFHLGGGKVYMLFLVKGGNNAGLVIVLSGKGDGLSPRVCPVSIVDIKDVCFMV